MSKKMLIIVIIAVSATLIMGGGAFFYFQTRSSDAEKPGEAEGSGGVVEKKMLGDRINFALDSFIVNLADPGGKRYLSTRIILEFSDKELLPSLEKKVPVMRDKILMILPTKAFKEIQSVEGKNALKTTLLVELNNILDEGKITNIFFQEFVVQ